MKDTWARHVEEINKFEGRLIHLILKFRGKKTLHLICCYGPASRTPASKSTIQKINEYITKISIKNEPTIIAGDFNEDYTIHNHNPSKCSITTNILEQGFVDAHGESPNQHTW